MYEYRCNERLKTKTEESTRLSVLLEAVFSRFGEGTNFFFDFPFFKEPDGGQGLVDVGRSTLAGRGTGRSVH
jgi:hypothetical protein